MNTKQPDDGSEDRTILPSAATPEPEVEPADLPASPQPIPPLPGCSRVNPHGVRRSANGGAVWHRRGQGSARPPQVMPMRGPQGLPYAMPTPSLPSPRVTQQPTVGLVGGGLSLFGVVLAAAAPFATFLSVGGEIRLWGAASGEGNAYVILAAAALGFVGGMMMMALAGAKSALRGAIMSMVAGGTVGAMTAYLLTNSDHHEIIAQGGSFGAAAYLLIGATGALLIGGILGLVQGLHTEGRKGKS